MIILGTNSIKDTGYDVANSLRTNRGSSDYLNKTFSGSGNRRTFTISFWLKIAESSSNAPYLCGASTSTTNGINIYYNSTSQLSMEAYTGAWSLRLHTSALLRDTSAWYHICYAIDTTQGTEANRVKLYINGVQQTFSTSPTQVYPSQNLDLPFNQSGNSTTINCQSYYNAEFMSAYYSEFCMVDGQALDPTSFGEFDEDSGIWKPIDVSGLTFGTNGFYLDFEDSSALGNDAAGSNNFTVNNLTAIDSVSDVPTNNFATLNPLTSFAGTFEEGNLKTTGSDDTVSTIGLTSGKWYWEAQRTNTSNQAHFGIGCSNGFFSATSVVSNGDYVYIRGDATYGTASRVGGITSIGSNGGTPATFTTGDILSFSLDLDSATKNITIKKNNGGTPLVDTDFSYDGSIPIFVYSRMNSGVGASFNFGNPATTISSGNTDGNGYGNFEYAVPSGYYALNTKNLAEYG